jgi:hypothetical protein
MSLFHMTPKQVADRLIAERLKVGDNAKALQKESINRQAKARSKAEDIKIQNDAEHSTDIK